MTHINGLHRFYYRHRQWFAYGATLLAAYATIATSYGTDYGTLSLPEQDVVLNAQAPEYRSRFQVETDDGKFAFRISFVTTANAAPHLELRAIGENANDVDIPTNPHYETSATEDSWRGNIELDCQGTFPCVAQFEVTVTADRAATESVEGTLIISATMSRPSLGASPSGSYLAIEPLP